jgi:hypothetical protein
VFAGPVNVTGGLVSLSVRGSDDAVDFQVGGVAPAPVNVTLNGSGVNASATATYDVTSSQFDVTGVSYLLGALPGSKTTNADLNGQIMFTPVVDVTWTLGGVFNWSGNWANGVSLFARIQDLTSGTDVTLHNYTSNGVLSNVSYVVGVGTGKPINIVGPVTGTLTQGRQYEFDFELQTDTNKFTQQAGTAAGNMSLVFVPEPATLTVLAFGGLAGLARRRR